MAALARLDQALASFSAPERARLLAELVASLEAQSPGAGASVFEQARRNLPTVYLIAPAPAAVLARLSNGVLGRVAQLHDQATGGVRQLQQAGTAEAAAAVPTPHVSSPAAAPASPPASRRRVRRVLFLAAVVLPAAWLVVAQLAAWYTRAVASDSRREMAERITTLRADIHDLKQRMQRVEPQAEATRQAETQRTEDLRQLATLRQQTDTQTEEAQRLRALAETLKRE